MSPPIFLISSLRSLFFRPWQVYIILLVFLANVLGPVPMARADDFRLPAPGVMVHLSPEFNPPILKGLKIHPDSPFRFDFILDKGDSKLSQEQIQNESSKLIKYFLVSLTIPEKDLWVNLSPYEKDRIIPQSFGLTEMGRDLLAEDYMLKQITASLIYPEGEVGRKFWKRIYQEATKKYGTTNIPVNTFNKVWIVPQKALVYENAKAGTAYVVESQLKVMLEQDYLSLEKHVGSRAPLQSKETNHLGSDIVRDIVIPELTKEVNEGKNFVQLRQVYNSLILATWYKQKIKDSILAQVYSDKNKLKGVYINDPQEEQRIYKRYLRAFKKGVFNYIKEEAFPSGMPSKEQGILPRKYFSGGVQLSVHSAMIVQNNAAMGINKIVASSLGLGLLLVHASYQGIGEGPNKVGKTGNSIQLSAHHAMKTLPAGIETILNRANKKQANQRSINMSPADMVRALNYLVAYDDRDNLDFLTAVDSTISTRPMMMVGGLINRMELTTPGLAVSVMVRVFSFVVGGAVTGLDIYQDIRDQAIEQVNARQLYDSVMENHTNVYDIDGIPIKEFSHELMDEAGNKVPIMIFKNANGIVEVRLSPLAKSVINSEARSGNKGIFKDFIKFMKLRIDLVTDKLPEDFFNKVGNNPSVMGRIKRLIKELLQAKKEDLAKPARSPGEHRLENQGEAIQAPLKTVSGSKAMATPGLNEKGGIDLSNAEGALQTQNAGEGIKFHFNAAQLAQLQNTSSFRPVIINIQPMRDLGQFLGLNVQEIASAVS